MLPVYESTTNVETHTKLELHKVNDNCVLFRETKTSRTVSKTGSPVRSVSEESFVHEGSATAEQIRKWVGNKPYNPGILVGPKKDRRRIYFAWYPDEWIAKLRNSTFERNELYSMGRQDVYTAVVDEGLSPNNLLARDHYDHAVYTLDVTLASQAVVFDYIRADVDAGHFRDLKAVAAKLLERDDIRIYVENNWSNRGHDIKNADHAVDQIPGYNESRDNGGWAVQFVWSPSQEDYDRVRAHVSDKEYRRQDMVLAALDMDIFDIAQFRFTPAERKLIEDACRCSDYD